jgi:RNA polymerase sigma-70 factor, ECF subfamily
VSGAGQKRGIFGLDRAKAGRCDPARWHFHDISLTKSFGIDAAGVSGTDRCYEPPGTQFVAAIPKIGDDDPGGFDHDLDHDFVINSSWRNKLKDRPNCSVGARVREREDGWTGLMLLAISGDGAAYHRLLKAVTPVLRAAARRGLARAGQPVDQSEDIVQDILLAVHLKRHTWDVKAPFAPWLFAIARNKLIDSLRRRGRRIFVNIEDFAETIPSEPAAEIAPASEVAAQLQSLPTRQREVLQSIAVDSASIKDTAAKFAMSEGAVRVALHRGLANLTAKLREQ